MLSWHSVVWTCDGILSGHSIICVWRNVVQTFRHEWRIITRTFRCVWRNVIRALLYVFACETECYSDIRSWACDGMLFGHSVFCETEIYRTIFSCVCVCVRRNVIRTFRHININSVNGSVHENMFQNQLILGTELQMNYNCHSNISNGKLPDA